MNSISCEICILGAGPAGLGATIELVKHGVKDIIIIDRNNVAGGLSRTEIKEGIRFDVGPHRFFTKNKEINQIWHETLGKDFIPVNRLTRIYYKNNFFKYPIKAFDVLYKLGPIESLYAMLSFAAVKLKRKEEAKSLEEWVIQKFGRKLYETFFKIYTEKIWGIPCNKIEAEWAAQRIKGLDIVQVIKNAIFNQSRKKIKTLVDQFDYPVLGAGQMYEVMTENAVSQGVQVMFNTCVTNVYRQDNSIISVDVVDQQNTLKKITAKYFFNSIPLTCLFKMFKPTDSEFIMNSLNALFYRDHITVNLLIDSNNLFPDQWIYVHTPEVQMARVTNYNNFSKKMVGHKNKTAISVEYFVFQHEDLWKYSDEDLKEIAVKELTHLSLIEKKMVDNVWVVRETESYPVYYLGYKEHYETLKSRLNQFVNLYSIGRGGMYKYNNQDHSTLSGILAARNYLKLPGSPYNLWNINVDGEYHENAKRTN